MFRRRFAPKTYNFFVLLALGLADFYSSLTQIKTVVLWEVGTNGLCPFTQKIRLWNMEDLLKGVNLTHQGTPNEYEHRSSASVR